jgi:hypothetical protein
LPVVLVVPHPDRRAARTAQLAKKIYWHRELPPLSAELISEHTVEADSGRVAATLTHRDELWGRCYAELMARAEERLIQEIGRLEGDYAHIHDEAITPKHDAVTGTSWLHGRFAYVLYRERAGHDGTGC